MSVQRALALSCSQISSSYDPGNGQNLYETTGRQQNKDESVGSQSLSLSSQTVILPGKQKALPQTFHHQYQVIFHVFLNSLIFTKYEPVSETFLFLQQLASHTRPDQPGFKLFKSFKMLIQLCIFRCFRPCYLSPALF